MVSASGPPGPPFRKILIANRGEIAVRIARACRELGIASVAIYSDADAEAPHVELCDEAVRCGPAPARESYLDVERVVALAREVGADAVHPGYGFFSENAAAARAFRDAGIPFVGPTPETIAQMGDKLASRALMKQAGVPVVPGSEGPIAEDEARAICAKIGFPVMIKASAGGGGRGLRLVESEDKLESAIARARSEASSSFGDGTVYVEKHIPHARHVEVQILADAHGSAIHLFERGCSIQRRHQKLVEEAPAPGVSVRLREELCAAAVAAARAVSYRSAGTVEFLLDPDDHFYFLEMNTRVQVEHAITEAITGVDIVKEGIRAAAGLPLSVRQHEIGIRGWAIECRIYAEDPAKRFFPSPGTLTRFDLPSGPGVRNDVGVRSGSAVTVHYDPMLGKLICWGADRAEAIARLRTALREYQIEGVATSLPFHRGLTQHPRFLAGDYDVGFVERHIEEILA